MSISRTEEQLVGSIARRRASLVEELAALVAIPTGPGPGSRLDECRGLLCGRLQRLGAVLELAPGRPKPAWLREGAAHDGEVPPFALLRRECPGAQARILLCGHIDTVFPLTREFAALDIQPDGRRGVGPGCSDMKGGLLVAVAALEAMEAAGAPLSWTFAIVSDEETGSFHADALLREEGARPRGAGGYDCGLIFEPALPDGGLVVERPGSGQFMIECRGRAAHVGRDFSTGVSAVRALAEAITRACDLADPANGCIVNVGPLEGGAATNIVPDAARAWGNVRYFSPAAESRLAGELKAMNANSGRLPSTRVELVLNRPAKPKTPAVERLAHLARSCALDLGQQLPFGTTGGVCDGNNLQAGGLPTIDTLGVRGGGLHTTQEWIDLDSLVDRAQLAALLLSRLAAAPGLLTTGP
ncbi:MAG: M20/M25/M40 family metallo-hydrolase [Phycisphaerales bacterium]